jgi:hypothetical protein
MFGNSPPGVVQRRRVRRWAALVAGVLVAAIAAGAVVGAQFDDGTKLTRAIGEGRLVKIADIASSDATPARGVFVEMTSTGHLCVWEAASSTSPERGGGCNTADDPLNGRALWFTLSYDGGPALADVKGATLFGLAARTVAKANVFMSDGSTREIRLRDVDVAGAEYRAFGYRFKTADLRKEIGPTTVVAIDDNGMEIDRQATGIGG